MQYTTLRLRAMLIVFIINEVKLLNLIKNAYQDTVLCSYFYYDAFSEERSETLQRSLFTVCYNTREQPTNKFALGEAWTEQNCFYLK